MKRLILIPFYIAVLFAVQSCKSNKSQREEPATTDSVSTAVSTPPSARPVHWKYEGEEGTAFWAKLDPAYSMCGEGKHQSPVNIVPANASTALDWKLDYKSTSLTISHNEHANELLNNGHTIQVTVDEGSTLSINDKIYHLKQFHFHTPSEHTIDGKNLPMEMHLVHSTDSGDLAVIGVLFEEGKTDNNNFQQLIANLPAAKGDTVEIANQTLDLQAHLPAHFAAYHYSGSLTTPPCSEDVDWFVLKEKVVLSKKQLAAFSSRIAPNNRPTQPLNDRKIEMKSIGGLTK